MNGNFMMQPNVLIPKSLPPMDSDSELKDAYKLGDAVVSAIIVSMIPITAASFLKNGLLQALLDSVRQI
jgi:hypothetical protein